MVLFSVSVILIEFLVVHVVHCALVVPTTYRFTLLVRRDTFCLNIRK